MNDSVSNPIEVSSLSTISCAGVSPVSGLGHSISDIRVETISSLCASMYSSIF